MSKVKSELGNNAVILHQKKVKPTGIFSIFKKSVIEVVAAIDEGNTGLNKANNVIEHKSLAKRPEDILKERVSQIETKDEKSATLSREIDEIKGMLHVFMKNMKQEHSGEQDRYADDEELNQLYQTFNKHEVDPLLIDKLLETYEEIDITNKTVLNKEATLKEKLVEVLEQYIFKVSTINKESPQIIFFVGPTGVGKTTTIAKLAAHHALNEGQSVGLISADTYRIAAVEQLRTYSDILNIPLEVVYKSSEINKAIDNLKHKDLIFIDTAGRSHKNKEQILELETLLQQIECKEVYFVISCTTRTVDIKEMIKAYDFLKDYKLIFTKLDEASTFGTIINTAMFIQKPLSYITTGQSVPDDIEILDLDKIVDLIVKEVS